MIVGAPSADGYLNISDSGEAYIFEYDSKNDNWTHSYTLKGTNAFGESFGVSCSVYKDVAAVGAIGGNGTAYMYRDLTALRK